MFLPFLQAPLVKVKAQFVPRQRFYLNHSKVVVLKKAYKVCQPDVFPEIELQLGIFAAFPLSSVTAERSFSARRLIKSYL